MGYFKAAFVGTAASFLFTLVLLSTADARANEPAPQPFDIRPQSLAAALSEFARQSHEEILFAPDIVAEKRSGGVRGTMQPIAALRILLNGSGLPFTSTPSGAILIGQAGDSPMVSTAEARDTSQKEGKKNSSQDFRLAQVDQGQSASPSPVGRKDEGLAEIIVTAQKREERLQDVPISMSVLSGKDLDRSTFAGVTDALNTVPGVAAIANQLQVGGTYITIRGVSPGGAFGSGASTVGYYVDSVPFGQIRTALVPDPDVYDLQQLEVLRGPQGTLYGANALNGVVRVLTNDPDLNHFDFRARVVGSTTETGGANYGGDVAVNIPIIDGALGARAVVGDDHQSGWINGPLGMHLNNGDLSNVRLKISAQPTDALSVGFSVWHSQQSYSAPSQSDANGEVTAVYSQPMYTQFNAYGIKVNYELPLVAISSATSYVVYANNNVVDATPVGVNATFNTNLASRVFSEEINLTSKLNEPWHWSAGGMYRNDKDGQFLYDVNYPEPPSTLLVANFNDTSKSAAVYGELGRSFLNDKLKATLGLRYFHDDEGTQANGPLPGYSVPLNFIGATSSATTPRAVLTWLPNNDLTVYASYSQGFRSGIPQDELVGSVIQSFPALKPDKLTNYEVGIKGTLWDRFVAYDAATYYIKWRDIQQELNVPISAATYVYVLVNSGSASGEGVDLSLKTRPLDGFAFGANFSWNNLHFDNSVYSGGAVLFSQGSRPEDSPEYTAGVSAQYNFPVGGSGLKGSLSVSGNYISPLYSNNLVAGVLSGNSLLLTRGRLAIEFPEHITVAAFVDNANNWNGSQNPYPGVPDFDPRLRPRTYGLEIDYHLL